ncbi:hypothetical protein ANTRET_LOCUS21 [Anthophora retusa]
MGNEEHSTNKVTRIKILVKSHIFYIVPDTFPLIEEGTIGLSFLSKYDYKITSNTLTIDGNSIPFQKHPLEPIEPGKAKIQTVYLEGKPTPIWFCNNVCSRVCPVWGANKDRASFSHLKDQES